MDRREKLKQVYSNPGLRERIKKRVLAGGKGGRPGQWSARKAQMVAQEYKKAGGGYKSGPSKSQKSLKRWTKQEWRTPSGKPSVQGPKATGEVYAPKRAIQRLLSCRVHCSGSNSGRSGVHAGAALSGLKYTMSNPAHSITGYACIFPRSGI